MTRAAYDAAGAVWGSGPTAVYDELARPLVDAAGELRGRRVLDVGTGAGSVAALLSERGAHVTASDQSLGMLLPEAARRPPAVVSDVCALPFVDEAFDVVTAGFVLNHLDDAVGAVRELVRVGRRVVATTFADEAAVDVKRVLRQVLESHGFANPDWYDALRSGRLYMPTPTAARDVLIEAGLVDVQVQRHDVRVHLTVDEILAWRWGMAQTASFVGGLSAQARVMLEADGRASLGEGGDLLFPVLVLAGQSS